MLVLVGTCPRGGSQYTADVLTTCGLQTRREVALRESYDQLRPSSYPGEVSWLAVPWFRYFSGPTILVARPPLNVIRSQYALPTLFNDDRNGKMTPHWLTEKHPDWGTSMSQQSRLQRCATFYLKWMQWGLENADFVWPLPIKASDIQQLQSQLRSQGIDIWLSPESVIRVSHATNSGQSTWQDMNIPWSEVTDDIELMRMLEGLSDRLGVSMFEEV